MKIADLILEINKGNNVRENLIRIKDLIKTSGNCYALRYALEDDIAFFEGLLLNEDAKIRKNTALIMGIIGKEEYLDILYTAYQKEEKLFVKSSYLNAISSMDYRKYVNEFKQRLKEIESREIPENELKHIMTEQKILTELVLSVDGIKKHKFTGYNVESKVILITNRNFISITAQQMDIFKEVKEFNAGIMARVNDFYKLMKIRTFKEVLFCIDGLSTCKNNPQDAAKAIAESKIFEYLQDRHSGGDKYYYRAEYKTKALLSEKSAFCKRFTSILDNMCKGKLVNSTSNYEIEIRLIENKSGELNILLKLFTLQDNRFEYRKESVAASIGPVNAALIMELSKDYLKEEARVLDPFCGVGTMLIERYKYIKTNTLYGIDIYADAIAKARKNTENANIIAHYINKDYFDFEHEYLFDEIITNLPRTTGHKDTDEINEIYHRFFKKSGKLLSDEGIMVVHTYEPELVESNYKKDFILKKKIEISKKEKSYLYIFGII